MSDMAQFITAIPKAELHVHIEGTIEADLLLTIADRNGIVLPYKSAADILAGQNKGKSAPKQNLDSFIDGWGTIVGSVCNSGWLAYRPTTLDIFPQRVSTDATWKIASVPPLSST